MSDMFADKKEISPDATWIRKLISFDTVEELRKNLFQDFPGLSSALPKKVIVVGASPFTVGTPSLEFRKYASERSKISHINCKTGKQLCDFCERFFHNVFMFGMNDEILHTGFLPMAHYLMALCVNPKSYE